MFWRKSKTPPPRPGVPTLGTRVRIRRSGWSLRDGCVGTVVQPVGLYIPVPDPSSVLVLLDDDPLQPRAMERTWSCVVNVVHLQLLDDEDEW